MADTTVGQAAIAADAAKGVVKGVEAKSNPPVAKETPAKTAEAAPVDADPNAGKRKYVVDGKDVYLTPEQADAYVQKGLAFEPKVSQLSRLQQETAQFLKVLETDPGKILYNEKFGTPEQVLERVLKSTQVNDNVKRALGQWYYDNVIVPEKMSPEQREAAEMKRKVEAYETAEKQRTEETLRQEEQVRVERALQTIKSQIHEAMQESGVPLDSPVAPQLAKRVAQIMQLGFVNGKTVTPKEAMAKARAELMAYQKSYFDGLDEDKLVEQLGKENAEKVRKYYLKQVKASEEKKDKKFTTPAKRDERKTMSPDEFREYLDGLKKGK